MVLLAHLAEAQRPEGLGRVPGEVRLPHAPGQVPAGRGVAIPENQQIELLEKAQRSGGDFQAFVAYLDNAITTTLLGQSSTTDQGPWKGTVEIQKDVRDEVVAAGMLDGALNRTVSRWLTEWNFPGAETPEIMRDAEPPEDLDKRAEREERITRITSLRPTKEHIEDVYGGEWEDKPEPEPMEPGGGPPGQGGRGGNGGGGDNSARMAARYQEALLDALDRAGDGSAGEWELLMGPIVEPILKAAEESASFEELRSTLREVLPELNDRELVKRLERNGFTAHLSGDAGLE